MPSSPYNKVSAYGKNQNVQGAPEESSREIDARALLTCASRLNDAKESLRDDPKSKEKLRIYSEAIRNNQRLWTIFQVALTDPENSLPLSLKVTLMNLGRYVDKTSFGAVGRYAPTLVDSLININRVIASGLSKKPEEKAMEATDPVASSADIPGSVLTSA